MRSAVGALCSAAAAEPLLAELCLVHCIGAAPQAEGHDREAAVAILVGVLGGGREAGRAALGERYRDPPARSEEYFARAIVSLVALRLLRGEAAALPGQSGGLAMLATAPFLGAERAAELCSSEASSSGA